MTDKKNNLGRAALFLATLIWGISFVLMDLALDSIMTLYILAFRFLGAAVILLIAGFRELKKLSWRYAGAGALMGAVLFAAYALQTYGLMLTTPGKNAFLTAAYCIIVPFLSWFVNRKRPDRYNIMAAVIGLGGVGLISLNDSFQLGTGDALTIACGFFFAVHIIVTGRAVGSRSPVLLTMLQFAAAGIIAGVLALIFEPAPQNIPPATVWNLVFMTVAGTALCIYLQVFGQKHTPPSQASVIMTFEAPFGAAASVIFCGEALSLRLGLGFLLSFAAFIISETKLEFLKKR
ncbi:MAG: DMT family transporter [Clostridiales bacterium]|nr:DMT family transporter [Clostridiales bacterium]